MEWVSSYKYLGLIIDNKLCFDTHVESVCKKSQQRLHCIRRLNTSNISRTLMTMYYTSYIESVLCFSICCWYGNVNMKHRNSLNGIVNQGSKIIGIKQTALISLSYRKINLLLQIVLIHCSTNLKCFLLVYVIVCLNLKVIGIDVILFPLL